MANEGANEILVAIDAIRCLEASGVLAESISVKTFKSLLMISTHSASAMIFLSKRDLLGDYEKFLESLEKDKIVDIIMSAANVEKV